MMNTTITEMITTKDPLFDCLILETVSMTVLLIIKMTPTQYANA